MLGKEMIAICTACTLFSICDNRNRLLPPTPKSTSFTITYVRHKARWETSARNRNTQLPKVHVRRGRAIHLRSLSFYNIPFTLTNGNPKKLAQDSLGFPTSAIQKLARWVFYRQDLSRVDSPRWTFSQSTNISASSHSEWTKWYLPRIRDFISSPQRAHAFIAFLVL
jgi:hypothetical protein